MVRTCAYPGCTNKDESGSPQTFHRFPSTNVALRRLWLLSLGLNVELTQLPKMRKLRVCSDHFSEDDYLPEGQTKKRILKSTAVPAPQDGQEYTCRHELLSQDQQRRKKWLMKGSAAWNALKTIVLDKNLLKDLGQMTLFKHTGDLEVLHSSMLKYAEKRRHFTYVTMQARLQLSIIDHNHNVGRQHDRTQSGQERYNVFHSRQSNQWVARRLYEPTTQEFRKDLVEKVIQRRLDTNVKLGDPAFHIHPPVIIPANIAPTPKPNKAELVSAHKSRFHETPATEKDD
ncbi:uncharacterized protein LOC121610987 [Chelmon rostratus]|uniref:uncharacterized protein LOC121610987 n=1 Tax=Chelmon rostratus TaxID=109905 RepID=UPI001BE79FF9|nr:uncharacterized protein LOC121610987 [Chelmon rostratus]